MKRRVYISILALAIISVILVSVTLCMVFYNQFSRTVQSDVRNRAELFKNSTAELIMSHVEFDETDMRVTLVGPDGAVIYDNTAPADEMPNHIYRQEIKEARELGAGESRRFSDTLAEETYYYAVKLADGYILRMSKTTGNIFGMFGTIIPVTVFVVLGVIIIGYYAAGKLTGSIISPISNTDFSSELSPAYDELSPFVRTIAEQRRHIAEQLEALKERAGTVSAIMDNVREGIILVNERGIILSANKSVLSVFGAGESMDGKNILELLRGVEMIESIREALGGNGSEMLHEHSGKIYQMFFSPVTGRGAIILIMDITDKAKAEKLRREFTANVSHELKTPLTGITGYAELLTSGMVKESDKQRFYGKIKEEASRLITMIEDIIMLSELDESRGIETAEEMDVAAVADEVRGSLSAKADENNISLRVDGAAARFTGNRSMIYEMLYNLVDNGIKYNKPGGEVKVEITNASGRIKITVADTGIGIPKAAQDRVFERFYRVDKSRSKKTGGTGLGLAIVKHIAIMHGGTVELVSEENVGTSITIVF